jgi:WD repeat-containing protein 48
MRQSTGSMRANAAHRKNIHPHPITPRSLSHARVSIRASVPPLTPQKPAAPTRESEQLAILDAVRAQPFRPPPPWEAPPLALRPETQLLISEESKDAGAWVVTYRSQVRATQNDLEAVEGNAPAWLLDYLFTSRIKAKDPVKLTFILEPAPGCGLREMPDG